MKGRRAGISVLAARHDDDDDDTTEILIVVAKVLHFYSGYRTVTILIVVAEILQVYGGYIVECCNFNCNYIDISVL